MIRSTINATLKTVKREGIVGQSIELYKTAAGAIDAVNELAWGAGPGTGTPVPSNSHWNGVFKDL